MPTSSASMDTTEEKVASTSSEREIPPPKMSILKGFKQHSRLMTYCLSTTLCIMLQGYDLAVVGNVASIPNFQKRFGRPYEDIYIIPSSWLAVWNCASPLGVIFGAILGSSAQGRWGRRASLAIGSTTSTLSIAVMFVSDIPGSAEARRGTFLASKIVQGLGIGTVICTTQTYLSEILPRTLRGPVLAFFPIFTLVGQLIGAIVIFITLRMAGSAAYRIPIASQWIFSVAPLLTCFVLPESPSWLVSKGRFAQAESAQRKLEPRHDPVPAVQQLREDIETERARASQTQERSFVDCFRRNDRRRTWIVILANCLPQIWGLALLSKASYFMQIIGMNATLSIVFLALGVVFGIGANVGSMWTLITFGRRPLILASLSVSAVLWAGMGISGIWDGTVTMWYTGATLMVIVIICGLGVWPAAYVVASETSSLELRGATQGVGWFAQGLWTTITTFVLPYIYNPDAGNLRSKTGFVFSGLCAVGAVLSWLLIPELKDMSQSEMDKFFSEKVSARDSSKRSDTR